MRTPARDSIDWDAAGVYGGKQAEQSLGCSGIKQGVICGLDRDGKPGDLRGQGIQRHTSQRIIGYHITLDALHAKKARRRFAERFAFDPILMPWTAPKVDVLAGGPIIMAAVSTTKVVDGLSGEGFGGKSGPGDDNLAVFVLVSGVGSLKSGHFYKVTACPVNQAASSSSLRLPSAR
jgi:hypothetical protein